MELDYLIGALKMIGCLTLLVVLFEKRIAFVFAGLTDIIHWENQSWILPIWS